MRLVARRPELVMVGSVLLFAVLVVGLAFVVSPGGSEVRYTDRGYVVRECDRLLQFTNAAHIEEHLAAQAEAWQSYRGGDFLFGGDVAAGALGPTDSTGYSGTNVQVEGVDELDIVKSDGTYVYTISGGEVVIVRAYPPAEAGVISRIPTPATGLFVDGPRLVVVYGGWRPGPGLRYEPYGDTGVTGVAVYDVSNPARPNLLRNVSVDGQQVGARFTGGIAYLVVSDYLYVQDGTVALPALTDGSVQRVLLPREIGYFRDAPPGGALTTVLAVDVRGSGSSIASFLNGYVGQLYVSQGSIYLSGYVYGYSYATGGDWQERTAIHRISFDGLSIGYGCTAEVPGTLLNQFSMDEYEGYLRIATTLGQWNGRTQGAGSGVYVLDGALHYVGSVEGLAPGETLHSVRFVGERAYVVTFKKIDPLFVVDLSDPAHPRLLGQLHIPGFSDYLHPFGPDHLIGVGKDTREGEGGTFAWFQGVKLSLFDVSDPMDPREAAKVIIGDRGSDTEVLVDHHAFLLHPERNLIVIPVTVAEIDPSQYPDPLPDWAYGTPVWQGAIVYSVSTSGFVEVGRVTHGGIDGGQYAYDRIVRRTLYIEDVLYTVSDGLVRMNELSTLAALGEVSL